MRTCGQIGRPLDRAGLELFGWGICPSEPLGASALCPWEVNTWRFSKLLSGMVAPCFHHSEGHFENRPLMGPAATALFCPPNGEVVLAAVRENGLALRYADESLQARVCKIC